MARVLEVATEARAGPLACGVLGGPAGKLAVLGVSAATVACCTAMGGPEAVAGPGAWVATVEPIL